VLRFCMEMNDTLDLSIIIVSWNVRDLLLDCLNSVYAETKGVSFEVFVVDNASSDGSAEMVEQEFPQVKLIRNQENLGFAKANNQAIRQSKGRYVLLLNPDTVVVNDALANMIPFMEAHQDVGAVGPRLLNPDGTVQLWCGGSFPTPLTEFFRLAKLSYLFPKSRIFGRRLMSFWDRNDTREVDLLSGACMMVRREAINQVGLMDEDFFMYADDVEWCYRIKKAGWKIYLYSDAEIIHLVGQSMLQSADKMAVEAYKSMYLFFKKHYALVSALFFRGMVFFFMLLWYLIYTVQRYTISFSKANAIGLQTYQKILRWSIGFPAK